MNKASAVKLRAYAQTAILVDGGFYRKIAVHKCGERNPQETAKELFAYYMQHLNERSIRYELYRIFTTIVFPIKRLKFAVMNIKDGN